MEQGDNLIDVWNDFEEFFKGLIKEGGQENEKK